MAKKVKIGIIGFGNMGSALGYTLKAKGWQILVYEKDKKKLNNLKGFKLTPSTKELIESADAIILAIKPQDVRQFIQSNKELLKKNAPLFISIAAGIPTKLYEKYVPNLRVLRVMPNLAARIKSSVSVISSGKLCKRSDLSLVRKLFSCVGVIIEAKENLLDMVTAISGSGPGYIYYFMDSMYSAAIKLGLSREQAKEMVLQTFKGATKLAEVSKEDFHALVQEVASSRGTTAAALDIFDKNNLNGIIYKGIDAAYRRAREISRLFI